MRRTRLTPRSWVGRVDRQLIDDGTYFVIDEGPDVIACGGWSIRDKLHTGLGAR